MSAPRGIWTDERIALARQLFAENALPNREVWAALNRLPGRPIAGEAAVAATLSRLGIRRPRDADGGAKVDAAIAELRSTGATQRDIAEALAMPRETVRDRLRVPGSVGQARGPRVQSPPATPRRLAVVRLAAPVRPPLAPIGPARTCQWPIGEPRTRGFRLCEVAPTVAGRSYCAEHCARAYRASTSPAEFAARRAA